MFIAQTSFQLGTTGIPSEPLLRMSKQEGDDVILDRAALFLNMSEVHPINILHLFALKCRILQVRVSSGRVKNDSLATSCRQNNRKTGHLTLDDRRTACVDTFVFHIFAQATTPLIIADHAGKCGVSDETRQY